MYKDRNMFVSPVLQKKRSAIPIFLQLSQIQNVVLTFSVVITCHFQNYKSCMFPEYPLLHRIPFWSWLHSSQMSALCSLLLKAAGGLVWRHFTKRLHIHQMRTDKIMYEFRWVWKGMSVAIWRCYLAFALGRMKRDTRS